MTDWCLTPTLAIFQLYIVAENIHIHYNLKYKKRKLSTGVDGRQSYYHTILQSLGNFRVHSLFVSILYLSVVLIMIKHQ